jgi:hypothetical protein
VWKQNTTVQVQVTVDDEQTPDNRENDLVSARAYLYYGEVNQQNTSFTTNSSAGTTFPFSFIANVTTANSLLRVEARDTGNPDDLDVITRGFTVSTSGAVFGESSCTESFEEGEPSGENATGVSMDPVLDDNSAVTVVREVQTYTGLGSTVIWILLTLLIVIVLWVNTDHAHHPMVMGLIAFVVTAMFYVGVKLQFIPTSAVITIGVVGLIVVGLWVSRMFFHPSGGS